MDIPAVSSMTFTVNASGYGSYTETNVSFGSNQTYEMSAALSTNNQTFDESTPPGDAQTIPDSSVSSWGSDTRVPPFIRVARFAQNSACAAGGTSYSVQTYPWEFYLLHVLGPEVGGDLHLGSVSGTADAEAIQSYAWYLRRHGSSSPTGTDVDNTTRFQCFKPEYPVKTAWTSWVQAAEPNYVGKSDGTVELTQYRAGTYNCVESAFPADGEKLSQLGAEARATLCGVTNWRTIDNYYYTGNVITGLAPPNPLTSFLRVTGGVKFTFQSVVGTSPVAWSYSLERHLSSGWSVIYNQGYSAASLSVPTTFTYSTAGCYVYRVKGVNPDGASAYSSFNGGATICPG